MISLASSVQTCMRFAGKQRAFLVPFFPLSFSTPLRSSPPPFSSFLFNRSRPSHGWFYSILLFHKLTPLLPSPFANEKKKKSGWPLMDTNIARVNRLIGQPMAEASLSSSPFLYRRPFFSRRRHCLASLLASSPVRHHVCTREWKGVTTSEERALVPSRGPRHPSLSFVIETPRFFTVFSPPRCRQI